MGIRIAVRNILNRKVSKWPILNLRGMPEMPCFGVYLLGSTTCTFPKEQKTAIPHSHRKPRQCISSRSGEFSGPELPHCTTRTARSRLNKPGAGVLRAFATPFWLQ